jgi:hypothetical protein
MRSLYLGTHPNLFSGRQFDILMNRFLNLVIVITFIGLTSVALFAAPQQDACGDPCGKPTAWDEFNKFELKMTMPREPGYSFWKGTFDKESLDIQINVEVSDGKKITKGQIFMVGGRVLATRGPVTEPGYEIDALDAPILEQELVVRLLGAALPLGPQEIKGARKIDYKNEKTGIQFATPSAQGFISAPWSVSGDVNVVAPNVIEYQLRLTAAGTGNPAGRGGEYMANFDGRLLKIASAKIEDSMPLGGWNLFGAPTAAPYKTVADIRKKIAEDDYPGEPDPSKNFTGFWKEDCDQAFGLQIMAHGTDGKYSIVFCGPGGCGDPDEGRITFITKDRDYVVVSESEIRERSANGWETYHRCTKDTHPVLKYKEDVSTAVIGDRSPATEIDRINPPDWEVVRSVPDESGGTLHFVVIPEAKQRDGGYYRGLGDRLCKDTPQCTVNFWTDRNHTPESAWMPVPDLAVMTASYNRHTSYAKARVQLACWLYPNKAIGEAVQCEYQPGAKRPPEK